jgi:hypothetical protein
VLLYYEWACLEALGGDTHKALSLVGKGLKEGAQPARWATKGRDQL